MKRTKTLLLVIVIIVCGLAVSFIGNSYAEEKSYEVQTQYSLPEYRTDTARAIDAYQQMINRLLDTNERNNAIIIAKLDAIGKELQSLSVRMEKIGKAVSCCRKDCDKKCKKSICPKKCPVVDPNRPAPEPMKKTAD